MLKRTIFLMFAVLLVFLTYSFTHAAGLVKLKAANYLPPGHITSVLLTKFCEEVNKESGGKVELTPFVGGTLLNPVKMAAGVASGIADIGFSHCSYTRGRFPVMEIIELPLGIPSGYVGTHVANDFYAEFKPKEWDGYKVLFFTTSPVNIVQTMKKPAKTLKDIKGVKLRGTGRNADIVKGLGGVPIPLQMGEVYEGLQRGVVEGCYIPLETLKTFRTGELIKYCSESWKLGSAYSFYLVMNKDKWNSLSSDVQKVISEVSEKYMEEFAVGWNNIDIEGREFFLSQGGKMIKVSDREIKKWIKATQPVITDFKNDLVKKGYSKSEVESWINFVKKRTAYWIKQEKKKKIPTPFKY